MDEQIHDETTVRLQELLDVAIQDEDGYRLHFVSEVHAYYFSVELGFFIDWNYARTPLGVQVYELKLSEAAQHLATTLKTEFSKDGHRDYNIYLRVLLSHDTKEDLAKFVIRGFIKPHVDDD